MSTGRDRVLWGLFLWGFSLGLLATMLLTLALDTAYPPAPMACARHMDRVFVSATRICVYPNALWPAR